MLVVMLGVVSAAAGAFVAVRWRERHGSRSAPVRVLAEHVVDNVSAHDADGVFRYASRGLTLLLGADERDIVGRHPRDFAHPEDATVLTTIWKRPVPGGPPAVVSWRCRRADGGYAWLETTARAAPADLQPLGAIVCASRDITERKQIEDALRESEQRLRMTLETVRWVAVALDRNGRVTFVNDTLCALTGWKRSDLIGESWFDLCVPPADRSRALFFASLASGEVAPKYDAELLCRDGRRRTIEWDNTFLRSSGAIAGMASLGADVTDRRQEEAALNLLQSITMGISSAQDVHHALAVAIESLCETTGWGYGEAWLPTPDGNHVERTTHFAALGVDAAPLIEADGDHVLARGKGLAGHAWDAKSVVWVPSIKEFESGTLHLRAGACGFGTAVALPIVAGDDVVAVLVFFMDRPRATDVRHTQMIEVVLNQVGSVIGRRLAQTQYEVAILRARDDAEAASHAKSEFLSRMSHELRTPLNSVIGFSNVMRKNKDGRLNADDLAFLERIVANGQHLLTLVNNVLDIARVEAGRLTVTRSPVAVDELIRDVVSQLEGQPRSAGVRLAVEVPRKPRSIESDPVLLRQVLINLVGNAIRFTHEGSVLVVADVDPKTAQPLRIHVRDTGIGIHPDRHQAIFDPFEQAESATHRTYGGTGLGLSISKAICDALGYRLTVDSDQGRGATFTVHITVDSHLNKLLDEPMASTPTSVRSTPSAR
jgi:PAS domain S-box-containing protein